MLELWKVSSLKAGLLFCRETQTAGGFLGRHCELLPSFCSPSCVLWRLGLVSWPVCFLLLRRFASLTVLCQTLRDRGREWIKSVECCTQEKHWRLCSLYSIEVLHRILFLFPLYVHLRRFDNKPEMCLCYKTWHHRESFCSFLHHPHPATSQCRLLQSLSIFQVYWLSIPKKLITQEEMVKDIEDLESFKRFTAVCVGVWKSTNQQVSRADNE